MATLLLACLLVLGSAAGAQVSFTAEIGGEMRTATLSAVESEEGVTYVSLESLVRQLGGEVRSANNQTQVDLAGASAQLSVGERTVSSSSDAFTLQQPLARVGEEPYIALVDISPFFFRGFEMFVSRYDAAETPATPPVESAPRLEPITPDEEDTAAEADEAAASLEADLLTPIGEMAEPAPATEESPAEPQDAEEDTTTMAAAAQEPPPALRRANTIVIDPGHGGYDTGAMGAQGLTEKDVCLQVATEVGRLLKAETALTIYLTRQEDQELTTPERVNIANEVTGDLIVSVHVGAARAPAGAAPGTSPRGCAVYYWGPPEGANERTARYTASSRLLAERISRSLAASMNGAWPEHPARAVPLRLLGDVRMPGVLVEAGFITSPEDAALLASSGGRERIARGIADGIKQALGAEAR